MDTGKTEEEKGTKEGSVCVGAEEVGDIGERNRATNRPRERRMESAEGAGRVVESE